MNSNKDISNVLERIKKEYGLTQIEIAESINYSREYLSQAKKNNSEALLNLLIDKFPPKKSEISNNDNPDLIYKMEEPQESYTVTRRNKKNKDDFYKAPLVSIKAQAGYVRSYDQTDYVDTLEKYALPPGITYHGAVWRYFEIEGNSMHPTFANGDIVLASQVPQVDWEDIRNFYIYVLVTDTRILIKRIFAKSHNEWVLISDNEEEYGQVLFDISELKQLWIFRRHLKRSAPPPKQFKITV